MSQKRSWIPNVPEEQIRQMAERILPVVDIGKGRCFIEPVDFFHASFFSDPRPASFASGLKDLCDITTYHADTYWGIFSPSIAEVLAQIPAELQDKVVAFEIVQGPRTPDQRIRDIEAIHSGFHAATTRLFAQE